MPDRPLRVLYCTDTYPPQVNGVSVVAALSVQGLEERGWECRVIAPRYPASAYENANGATAAPPAAARGVTDVPSTALPGYPDLRLAAPLLPRVMGVARRFAPDLMHAETEFVIGRLGQIAARRLGIPLATSYHTDFGKYAASYGAPWLRGSVSAYLARFHRRARRTYTPSEAAAGELRRLGVAHAEVWGRGVDARLFAPHRASAELRASITGGAPVFTFLYVGRLAAEKSVDRLLAAFRGAEALLPAGTIRLVIAGAGPREAALRAAAPPSVAFLGYLDRGRTLPQLYASVDTFVFASETETLGLVVLEAMASGLPVIAVPAGGVAEHLRDDVNGLAVSAGDVDAMARAMARLATNAALRARLSAGARATAEAMSWDAELDRLDASYRRFLRVEREGGP